jgi:putative FmdB family regulatory protein
MPIYAYKCSACGHAEDVLQKISDTPLTVCPSCGQAAYAKQVTAAGFQLKGSGWYVTDFRGGSNGAPSSSAKPAASGDAAAAKPESSGSAAPAESPAPAAAPPASAST